MAGLPRSLGHGHVDLVLDAHQVDGIQRFHVDRGDQAAGFVEEPHKGRSYPGQPFHRARHECCNPFRGDQRKLFGHQLTDDERGEGGRSDYKAKADVHRPFFADKAKLGDAFAEGLALRLTLVLLCFNEEVLDKALVLLLQMFTCLDLLLELLLLVTRFELVLVLEGLASLLLLFSN